VLGHYGCQPEILCKTGTYVDLLEVQLAWAIYGPIGSLLARLCSPPPYMSQLDLLDLLELA
jgi:hypothetical protein